MYSKIFCNYSITIEINNNQMILDPENIGNNANLIISVIKFFLCDFYNYLHCNI